MRQHANMLLDINGKMVRTRTALVATCACVCFKPVTLAHCVQVSATEECIGPMRLTQEPIQVRAKRMTDWFVICESLIAFKLIQFRFECSVQIHDFSALFVLHSGHLLSSY